MNSLDFYVKLESIATAVGALMTTIGLLYAGIQLRASRKIARGEFLLQLDELFHPYNEVHTKLRPGGEWSSGHKGPVTVEEWVSVERYMGLFERIKLLIDDGIIDLDTVDRIYGYRVLNIISNNVIRQAKLEREKMHWEDFVDLWQAVEQKRQKRFAQKKK
jgi:hypothetical protein